MLNKKEKEVIKNYYLEDYINTIRYILTFDSSNNNKYTIDIENKPCDNGLSLLLIRITTNKVGNINKDLMLSKEIKGYLPGDVAKDVVNEIRNHFIENHYIVYSSVCAINNTQTLQNEKFTVYIKLNNEQEIEEAYKFNDKINSNKRHATKVLKMI